jgi:hypothetical protein
VKVSLKTGERGIVKMRCREMTNAFEAMLKEVDGMGALTHDQVDGLLRT